MSTPNFHYRSINNLNMLTSIEELVIIRQVTNDSEI